MALAKYGSRLGRVPGVRSVYVGFDCGLKGEHYHIIAHHPAIVVELDGTQPRAEVREAVFQEAPSLGVQPLVFVDAK